MNYLKILKKAWFITWNNKFLWWFGFFIGLGGAGFSGFNNSDFNEDKAIIENKFGGDIFSSFNIFWENNKELIIGIGLAIIILMIFISVLKIISRGALISSLVNIKKRKKINFKIGFKSGRKFFWKLLGLKILIRIMMLIIIGLLSAPVIVLFKSKAYMVGGLLALPALMLFIVAIILLVFSEKYAQIYMVTSKTKIFNSLRLAYKLFLKNIGSSILLGFILLGIGVLVGIGFVIVILFISLPFALSGAVLGLIGKITGIVVAVGVGLVAFFVFSSFVGAIYQTFLQTVWFLFFEKIAGIKKEKEDIIAEKIETPLRNTVGVGAEIKSEKSV